MKKRYQNLASIRIEEKVGELGWTVVVAGSVDGRHEVVVYVVIVAKHHDCYGLGQVSA